MDKVELISGKKVTSVRRQQASRANGAKSHGPVTPEGKARSSRNAVTHGLAALITLSPEDEETFCRIQDQYIARFDPRDQLEHDLVEQLAYANFQMRQAWMHYNSTMNLQMTLDAETVKRAWNNATEQDRRALAFAKSIQDTRTIPLLLRYVRSFESQIGRTTKLLTELRKQRLPPAPDAQPAPAAEMLRKEPSPINEHSVSTPPEPVDSPYRPVYGYASPAAIAAGRSIITVAGGERQLPKQPYAEVSLAASSSALLP